ncbi:putative quinol monooxygenase [Salinibacterium sp. ZJ454]|uniref:putative quinol monooxygenase n=1 Tax=Salinibacterium sp. ZJ454 TaxID=2708339 RepID=UPI00141E742A|nr:putative quinol monooxygenase [Salinibacterium sp. ZJ454]
MSNPIVVTAIFEPAEGQHDAVLDVLKPSIAAVHEEDGCLLYAIHEDPTGTIVMIEKWATEQLLDIHGNSPAVVAQRAALDGLLARPIEVTRLVPIPAGTPEQGQL